MVDCLMYIIFDNDFLLQLLVAYCLFVGGLKRRSHFTLRLTACILGCFLFSLFTPQFISFEYGAAGFIVYALTRYTLIFALTLLAVKICFECSWSKVLFCGICAYATQHAFYKATTIPAYAFAYWVTVPLWLPFLSFWILMLATYSFSYYFFARRIVNQPDFEVNNLRLIIIVFLLLIIMVIMSFLGNFYVYFNPIFASTPSYIIFALFSIISCYLALSNLLDNANNKKMENENRMLHLLWRRDRDQYQISKRNIEFLNIKFHDLKYYFNTVIKDEALLKEVNEALKEYDSMIYTQNETLDVVISEKNLYCSKIGIRIACIADGECLDMLKAVDIYSLFGNALDNAIECLSKVNDEEKKVINVIVKKVQNMVSIQIENYVPDDLEVNDGFVQTTKADKLNHGYGLKSIRRIAQKYKGNMFIKVHEHVFSLMILLPVL